MRLTLALLLAIGSCVPAPKPPDTTPTVYSLTVVVCEASTPGAYCLDAPFVAGARVQVPGGTLTTNANGYVKTTVPVGTFQMQVEADGYNPTTIPVTLNRATHIDVRLHRPIPPLAAVRAEGRFLVTDAGTFRAVFTSELAILARTPEERNARLDEIRALGFNGFRVFAGDLGWAGQTTESAIAALPGLLTAARQRGLYALVVALTGTALGYDPEAHVRTLAGPCAITPACIIEGANELGHPTQSAQVSDPVWLASMLQRVIPSGTLWAVGAMLGQDELIDDRYPADGGRYSTAHLNRDRPKWEQVRRVREIAAISETTDKPAMSGEPIGAAEVSEPGRRESDPAFFYAYGALCRLFEVACVFHSEDGLNARPLSTNQRVCAQDFLAGFHAIDTDERLAFKNASWPDSPVKTFTKAVRVYSGVYGDRGYTVVVGDEGVQVEWQHGWRVTETLGTRPGVTIWRIERM